MNFLLDTESVISMPFNPKESMQGFCYNNVIDLSNNCYNFDVADMWSYLKEIILLISDIVIFWLIYLKYMI